MIATLLASRLFGPVASVAAVLALALSVGQCTRALKAERRADKAEAVADKAMADFTTCKANTTTLEAALEAQSRAVAGLKAESDRRVAQSAKAARDARAVAESARRHADRVLAMRAPEDVCAGALDVLRGG
jgi:membrane protein involved in colicin uptake